MDQAKIMEVFSDELFVKKLLEMESDEEMQAALEEKDVDVSVDDIKKVKSFLDSNSEAIKSGELNEDQLEGITGGAAGTLSIILKGIGS